MACKQFFEFETVKILAWTNELIRPNLLIDL